MLGQELIDAIPGGILRWYSFNNNGKVLYIGGSKYDDSYVSALLEAGLQVDRITYKDINEVQLAKKYDYVVMMGIFEICGNPKNVLKFAKERCENTGKILIGTDNRLAVRYFCGDRDPYTDRSFDGIENYTRIDQHEWHRMSGRTYDKAQIRELLEDAGINEYKFFSILPEMSCPQIIIADEYKPQEEFNVRIFPQYNYPDSVFLEEEKLYTSLFENNMFHQMANGFFIECGKRELLSNAEQITISMERGKDNAMCTIIRNDNCVEKKSIYNDHNKKILSLKNNNDYLASHGVKMIDAKIDGNSLIMPYIKGKPATEYFKDLLLLDENVEKFYNKLDELWNIIVSSSEKIDRDDIDWDRFEPDWYKRKTDDPEKYRWKDMAYGTKDEQDALGPILKRGYMDLVLLNAFYVDDEFVFYDQEMYMENVPAKAIFIRSIDLIYRYDSRLNMIVPMDDVYEKYNLKICERLFYGFNSWYLDNLRNDTVLKTYHDAKRVDYGVLNSNRQRMNYSTDEYDRIFRDIFKNIDGKKIYVFGSGNYARKFISQFGNDYNIAGIIDNNKEKWGTYLQNIEIFPPDYLLKLPEGSFKLIICIKNYIPVIKQLKEINITNYGIFDTNINYPRRNGMVNSHIESDTGKETAKKYHVGYIAGVFDLFHIGHLNMFKRAKELCDYLIVGVVTDESVMKTKKTTPYIPFEERIEIVRSCRYVDEAVEIPTDYSDTDEAYRRYQFDVQFSGSDYENDPNWLAKKSYLQRHGSDLVFFPYTQSTNSTKLKAAIDSKIR